MRVVAKYSHNGGEEFIQKNHPNELREIFSVINAIDASKLRTKKSKEKTMLGRMLYNPKGLNSEFLAKFRTLGWEKVRLKMVTKVPEISKVHEGFREMDLVKNRVGLEVQFGKYAFMVYNILAKMTIFAKKGMIDCGVELVSMRSMSSEMSTGVSYFEQIKADLEYRGIADLDIPIIVLGIDA